MPLAHHGARRGLRIVAALALACAALAGCFTTDPARTGGARPGVSYPVSVDDFGRYDRFPAEVAGYRRVAVLSYAPGLVDYSIGYDRHDAAVDSVVTLYFYPRMNDTVGQLRTEEQQVLQTHRATRLVAHKTMQLTRNGAPFEAHVTTFEYDELFHGAVQPVASELLVVFRAQGVFKVRATAPRAQAAPAEAAMLQLLEGVAWDAPEAFDGR